MNTFTTDAINIKTYPLSENDNIVVMFSKDKGLIKGVAKGVKKPKSKLGARMQMLVANKLMLNEGKSMDDILDYIFGDMDLKILEEIKPEFSCNCSREKVEKALISIGEKDLREIYEDGKNEELKCHFCNKTYVFTPEEIGRLLANSNRSK